MKSLRIMMILAIIFAFTGLCAEGNNSAASYIRMGVGAKSLAMGSTGVASIDNVTAAYWNPAALSRLSNFEISTMYTSNLGYDRSYNFAAIGMDMKHGYVAVSWINASMTGLQGYDENNNYTGEFDDAENNLALSYGIGSKRIRFGLNAKMYSSNIDENTKTGYGLDAGAIFEINEYMSLGMMMRDLFGELDDESIPYHFIIGAAVYPYDGVALEFDFRKEEDINDITVGLGAEYWLSFTGRGEAGSGLDNRSVDQNANWSDIFSQTEGGLRAGVDDGNFTAGFGIRFRNFETNYAYVTAPEEFMNDTHRFELILRF